jgi:hypothetical protein
LALQVGGYREVKDPCPVFDGVRWHLFGTAVLNEHHQFAILHATAPAPDGPWRAGPVVDLVGVTGGCVAAPGVIADGDLLHMFVQTEYNVLDGRVEHFVSDDAGTTFVHSGTALVSHPGSGEAGIYDPHPALLGGVPHLVYSGFSRVGRPDIYLARSTSGGWQGPWERRGCILRHEDVPDHNQHDDETYEWGLEGAQLVELPDGRVLLNAVCFLAAHPPGERQRVFFAVATDPGGPYDVLGPVLAPPRNGENGHATVVVKDGALTLFFQERVGAAGLWRYGLATASLDSKHHNVERKAA